MARGIYNRTWMEEARKKKGYSMANVADKAQVNVSVYCRIEKGLIEPGVKSGLRICNCLEVNPKMFLIEQQID